MMRRYLKPVLVYKCPRKEMLVSESQCKECQHYEGAEWHERVWTVFCSYEGKEVRG